MLTTRFTARLFWVVEAVAAAAALAAAIELSTAAQWQPAALVLLLLALALIGDRLSSAIGGGVLSTAHTAMVLTICLLGPAPAVGFGLAAAMLTSALRRLPAASWITNLASLSLYPLAGSAVVAVTVGDVHSAANHGVTRGLSFGLLVFAVSLTTIAVNFLVVALDTYFDERRSVMRQVRESFLPLLPGHLAAGILAGLVAIGYTNLGMTVLIAAIVVLATFHYLTGALLRSEERADQLEARSIHLANLQLGVLRMLMDALALRDRTTSRHAGAVARYAKALAVEIGLGEDEQEIVQTAALLHDIGKFTWSDRVLHPEKLTDDDWAVIRRHPQDGAALVGKLDGYGAVADAILYHHERVDGGGYPAGLISNEIPLASRIVAICSTYDTMTASSRYGPPLEPADAMSELRRAAGTQFDGELVDAFVAMLEREGTLIPDHLAADFAEEFDFAQRVRRMALPIPGRTAGS
ncbi:MAG: HD-GYP domain-containing protein [Solirubrobacteraceae bacterium]